MNDCFSSISARFNVKFELLFVSTQKNSFSKKFFLKPTERAQVPLKNGIRDFLNCLPFERISMFLCDNDWKF